MNKLIITLALLLSANALADTSKIKVEDLKGKELARYEMLKLYGMEEFYKAERFNECLDYSKGDFQEGCIGQVFFELKLDNKL